MIGQLEYIPRDPEETPDRRGFAFFPKLESPKFTSTSGSSIVHDNPAIASITGRNTSVAAKHVYHFPSRSPVLQTARPSIDAPFVVLRISFAAADTQSEMAVHRG